MTQGQFFKRSLTGLNSELIIKVDKIERKNTFDILNEMNFAKKKTPNKNPRNILVVDIAVAKKKINDRMRGKFLMSTGENRVLRQQASTLIRTPKKTNRLCNFFINDMFAYLQFVCFYYDRVSHLGLYACFSVSYGYKEETSRKSDIVKYIYIWVCVCIWAAFLF